MLREVDMISFWFPKETICPIVLYELGAWSASSKKIFVGVYPDYKRKLDFEIQTKLVVFFIFLVFIGYLIEKAGLGKFFGGK